MDRIDRAFHRSMVNDDVPLERHEGHEGDVDVRQESVLDGVGVGLLGEDKAAAEAEERLFERVHVREQEWAQEWARAQVQLHDQEARVRNRERVQAQEQARVRDRAQAQEQAQAQVQEQAQERAQEDERVHAQEGERVHAQEAGEGAQDRDRDQGLRDRSNSVVRDPRDYQQENVHSFTLLQSTS